MWSNQNVLTFEIFVDVGLDTYLSQDEEGSLKDLRVKCEDLKCGLIVTSNKFLFKSKGTLVLIKAETNQPENLPFLRQKVDCMLRYEFIFYMLLFNKCSSSFTPNDFSHCTHVSNADLGLMFL